MDIEENEQENPDLGETVMETVGTNEHMASSDEKEMEHIREKTCRCKNPFAGLECSHKFPDEYVFKQRYQINVLTADQKLMFLVGSVSAGGIRSKKVKGRWCILNKQNDHHLEFNRPMVYACCSLHDICQTFQNKVLSAMVLSHKQSVGKRSQAMAQQQSKEDYFNSK